jgi:hypothetical protein
MREPHLCALTTAANKPFDDAVGIFINFCCHCRASSLFETPGSQQSQPANSNSARSRYSILFFEIFDYE